MNLTVIIHSKHGVVISAGDLVNYTRGKPKTPLRCPSLHPDGVVLYAVFFLFFHETAKNDQLPRFISILFPPYFPTQIIFM